MTISPHLAFISQGIHHGPPHQWRPDRRGAARHAPVLPAVPTLQGVRGQPVLPQTTGQTRAVFG